MSTLPPGDKPPSSVDSRLIAAVDKQMELTPWGIKQAYSRNYLPFCHGRDNGHCQARAGVVRSACTPAGWLAVLSKFPEGKYTPEETTEIEYSL